MKLNPMQLNTPEELIEDIRQGKMVVLMDDEDRENEGDLVMAASCVRAEDVNFMAKEGRGLICLTLSEARCKQLELPLMVSSNNAQHGTNFTMSIEAAEGVTTGISAADRAVTIKAAVAPNAKPADIVQPGHIFPLMAEPGGVLHRAGHTEAGCDLARLAGLEPSAMIVEIMNEDGTMARRPDLEVFAQKHNLKIGTIADLIHYRLFNEKTVERISEETIKTKFGEFKSVVYQDLVDNERHLAIVLGDLGDANKPPVVRAQYFDVWRDALGVELPDRFSWSTQNSLELIAKEGSGVLMLLGQTFSSEEMFTFMGNVMTSNEASKRIGTGSQILRELGIKKMRLLSSPMRFNALSGFDLEIVEYIESI
jgi:3,4-dihydroxy 2-butanone 4-phosphate synthase/GTP cyclohydrolase II